MRFAKIFKKATAIALMAALAVPALPFSVATVQAATSSVPLYTVEDFFTFPETLGYTLHPNGEYFVFSAPVEGVINVFTRHIETGEVTQLTFAEEQHILNMFFKGSTVLYLQDGFGDENFHIFRMNEDGTSTNLTPFAGAMAIPVNLLEDTDVEDEILIMMNREDPTSFNTYRLNIFTGDINLVLEGTSGGIMTDNNGVIRVIANLVDGTMFFMHRYTDDDEFELVTTVGYRDTKGFFFFDPTNTYVYGVSNLGRDTTAAVRINPATAEILEVIFEVENYDVSGLTAGRVPGTLGSVVYFGDFMNQVFFCDEREAMQNQVAAHFPEGTNVSITSFSTNWDRAIVSTHSDICRGRQYFFNIEDDILELMLDTNFAPTEHMAPMMPITYEARDGLTIQGYLTLPVGVEPVDLPVIVIVHGGPWARDFWGFHPEVQFLANRGYAVLQPNFRGSTGFGREFLDAGDGQWGLAMQDDITDGVLWLIEQGIADPDRIGIYGGSYGGYSTLAGVAFTPELFAAAISYVPVSSIFTLLESIPPHWEGQREMFHSRVGHPIYDYEALRATSPLYHVENIITPLFIAHGANDVRTTLPESVNIVQALNDHGTDVEFMVRWDEGHGFINEQNRLQFYATMEAFFAEHLGGRTGTTMDEIRERGYTDTLEEVLAIMNQAEAVDSTESAEGSEDELSTESMEELEDESADIEDIEDEYTDTSSDEDEYDYADTDND